jgi:RNA polymerase sigma-70 factor, ECF subfamily
MDADTPTNNGSLATGSDSSCNEEFLRLYSQHQRELFKFIFLLVPNHANAEDILQDTSVVLWRKFGQFSRGTDFFRWAAQIARYKVLEYRKKATRDRHLFWQDDLIEAIAETRLADSDRLLEQRNLLAQCVRKLAEADRELLLRCFAKGRTIKAVAGHIGRPVNTVYKALNRIRNALIDCVEKARWRENRG